MISHIKDPSRGPHNIGCTCPHGYTKGAWDTTYAYRVLISAMLVRDDPKLPDDSEEVRKLNRVVRGSIPSYEIVSLLDGD